MAVTTMTVLPDVLVLIMGMGTDVHVDEGMSDLDEGVVGVAGVVGVVLGGVVLGVVIGGSVGGVVIGVVGVVVGVVTGVVIGVVMVGELVVESFVGEVLTVSTDLVVSCTGVVIGAGESPEIITGP